MRLRTGLVLDGGGGLLRPSLLATRLFAGGPLAGGRHWMPWISMARLGRRGRVPARPGRLAGPVNVVGPDPVRNADFTAPWPAPLHRPAPWPIPRFALRIVLGEFADEAVASQRVLPAVLNRAGYTFDHSDRRHRPAGRPPLTRAILSSPRINGLSMRAELSIARG